MFEKSDLARVGLAIDISSASNLTSLQSFKVCNLKLTDEAKLEILEKFSNEEVFLNLQAITVQGPSSAADQALINL